jgi:hypothetical protein
MRNPRDHAHDVDMKTQDPTQDLQDGVDLTSDVRLEAMRDIPAPYPRLCEAGPCRNYHRLETEVDAESSLAFRVSTELPAGTPGVQKLPDGSALYRPGSSFHVQVSHYCYPSPGIDMPLGSMPVVRCNRWDPITEDTEEDHHRFVFGNSTRGAAYAAEVIAWEGRRQKAVEAEAAAAEVIAQAFADRGTAK